MYKKLEKRVLSAFAVGMAAFTATSCSEVSTAPGVNNYIDFDNSPTSIATTAVQQNGAYADNVSEISKAVLVNPSNVDLYFTRPIHDVREVDPSAFRLNKMYLYNQPYMYYNSYSNSSTAELYFYSSSYSRSGTKLSIIDNSSPYILRIALDGATDYMTNDYEDFIWLSYDPPAIGNERLHFEYGVALGPIGTNMNWRDDLYDWTMQTNGITTTNWVFNKRFVLWK